MDTPEGSTRVRYAYGSSGYTVEVYLGGVWLWDEYFFMLWTAKRKARKLARLSGRRGVICTYPSGKN